MHHVRFADHVVILGKGGKVLQDLPARHFLDDSNELRGQNDSEMPQILKPKQESIEPKLLRSNFAVDSEVAAAASRQTGDVKAYTLYSQIAGWKTISIWLFFNAVFMFGLNFPCKSPISRREASG